MRAEGAFLRGLVLASLALVSLADGIAAPPQPLSEIELREAATPTMGAETARRVRQTIDAVEISNEGSAPPPPPSVLRVGHWNLDKSFRFDRQELLLRDPRSFIEHHVPRPTQADYRDFELFAERDVYLLNEVELGICRSGYHHVARELARARHLSYAFATEFLEVDPVLLAAEADPGRCDEDFHRARQLHGNAILSRFPIVSARRIPLASCHDWFEDELRGGLLIGRRQLRRGERMALVAEIEISPGRRVTLVATHLESSTVSFCRAKQMRDLLRKLEGTDASHNPIVLAGDLNTAGFPLTHQGLMRNWEDAGFDLSGNDRHSTFVVGAVPWARTLPFFRLDHLGARRGDDGRDFEPISPRTLRRFGRPGLDLSDHLPIVADIQLGTEELFVDALSPARPPLAVNWSFQIRPYPPGVYALFALLVTPLALHASRDVASWIRMLQWAATVGMIGWLGYWVYGVPWMM